MDVIIIGYAVQRRNGKVNVTTLNSTLKCLTLLSVSEDIFKSVSVPALGVVSLYRCCSLSHLELWAVWRENHVKGREYKGHRGKQMSKICRWGTRDQGTMAFSFKSRHDSVSRQQWDWKLIKKSKFSEGNRCRVSWI